jgi:hypothetical protein
MIKTIISKTTGMKNRFFKRWASLVTLAMIAMITMVSCEKDPDPDPTPTISNGYYIMGAGTALTDLNDNGKMTTAKNEVDQANLSSLLELYVAVSAGTDGFNIVKVISGEETILGPGTDFAVIAADALDGEEPSEGLQRGAYVESETAFTVPEDGLYHVVIDNANEIVAIAKVEWGLIGAATPNGWGGSTQLGEPAFELNVMEFSSTNVNMNTGEFKYRYSNGWKILIADEVRVNTNFGGAVDNLVAGGDNINNEVAGVYTATIKWELGEGTSATLTKTGDAPLTDYSAYEVGFIGDGIIVSDTVWGWGATYNKVTPAVDGTNYSWEWAAVSVSDTSAFKIRQGEDWDGLNLGFGNVSMAGASAANFSDNDGNFKATEAGTFDFALSVDAAVGDFTLTVDPSAK